MIKQLQEEVKKLFNENKIRLLVGYGKAEDGAVTPIIIESGEEADKLVWNENCIYNLSNYLPEIRKEFITQSKVTNETQITRIGIVAKGCDVKSIIGLIQEYQIKRDDIFIIGIECEKQMIDNNILEKCKFCNVRTAKISDILIKSERPLNISKEPESNSYVEVVELDSKAVEERANYWKEQFEKCIRCYACRQVCPLCYCRECIADQNIPQWILPSPSTKGNIAWNVIRAYHLAGRCIGCGECERVCPVNIPLTKLNKKMTKEIKELFDYSAGEDEGVNPPLDDFKEDDPQDFIR